MTRVTSSLPLTAFAYVGNKCKIWLLNVWPNQFKMCVAPDMKFCACVIGYTTILIVYQT